MAFLSWSIFSRVVLVAGLVSIGACGRDDATPAASGAIGSTPAPSSAPSPALTASVSSRMVAELPANTLCPQANAQTLVYAGVECLVVRIFGTPSSAGGDKLVVFLHSDVSAGGAADYMDAYAPAYAGPGVLTVRLLRPGYSNTYIQALAGRGVPARQVSIPGAAHAAADLFTHPVVQGQIRTLIS